MCSGSEAGSYVRLIDFVCQSTLGLRVIKKKKKVWGVVCRAVWGMVPQGAYIHVHSQRRLIMTRVIYEGRGTARYFPLDSGMGPGMSSGMGRGMSSGMGPGLSSCIEPGLSSSMSPAAVASGMGPGTAKGLHIRIQPAQTDHGDGRIQKAWWWAYTQSVDTNRGIGRGTGKSRRSPGPSR